MDIERIRRKLISLKKADRHRQLFGADDHRYELNTVLSEAEVSAFEALHVIRLPAECRAFIVALGNGGAGPSYGIHRLGEDDQGAIEQGGWTKLLAQPFPHVKPWQYPPEFADPPEFATDEEEEVYSAREDAIVFDVRLTAGAMPICHHGCARQTLLIVTGSSAGQVWDDGRTDGESLQPHVHLGGQPMSFGEWYEAWLDSSLETHAHGSPRKWWKFWRS